ncbi:hypothetical protein [Sphingomonas sp.]|jgi:hypothetical protein|uniref:hypothetical protein n=1 Tax=Sphingomonas sp. TaxID=28214 RepID=UPI0035697D72
MSVIDEIAAERRRQIEVEGWIPEHDDKHDDWSLCRAAACYADVRSVEPPAAWPWSKKWWKPKSRRRNMIRSAALLIAEIERMDRLAHGVHERELDDMLGGR